MRLNYTIIDSLDYFKKKIRKLEQDLKDEPSELGKMNIESIIVWHLERAVEMMKMAKPGEMNKEIKDWFLSKEAKRPDIKRLERLLKKRNN